MGVNKRGGGQGDEPPEFVVEDANANCPPDLQKIPLRVHQNTPFRAKILFFWAGVPRPIPIPFDGWTPLLAPTRPSGSTFLSLAESQADVRYARG